MESVPEMVKLVRRFPLSGEASFNGHSTANERIKRFQNDESLY